MNILASYNWIKEYLKTDQSVETFASEMSLKSMSVEEIIDLKKKFDGMVIGFVDEIKDHPNADKLKIAVTNIGDKQVDIVCGGMNLKQGQRVVVTLPGSKVRWHGEGDLIELKETEIRGAKSYGMICAGAEVGFEKAHTGEKDIWDLTDITDAEPGTPFSKAFDMEDYLMDIEVTTNRSDSMNIIGLAREAGVATDGEFVHEPNKLPAGGTGKDLKVDIQEKDLCPRYMAVVIDGIKVGPSPAWLQRKILLSGHRPINNIVDITNLILHEYGQPLHAFDYDKLKDGTIIVRRANDGEKFVALDEKEYELASSNLVIADAEKSVALAGIMGGLDSGTWNETTTIVFEAATFDALTTRKTARSLNLYSDSQSMFEKGLSTESPESALARAVELTLEIAGGQVASQVIDIRKEEYQPLHFPINHDHMRRIIGVDIPDEDQIDILKKLGFTVSGGEVTVPYWRDHDIEHSVDFAEEIARMYGYHNIPSKLPSGQLSLQQKDQNLKWEGWMKRQLQAAGYTEFFSYSFIGEDEFRKYDLDTDDAVKIYNPLSSDLTHMRTSLMPSLLSSIAQNQKHTPAGRVFEIARIYEAVSGNLPNELTHVVIAKFGPGNSLDDFRELKGIVDMLNRDTGLALTLHRINDDPYWHASRSAEIKHDGRRIGVIGQVADEYQKQFGIDYPVMVLQMDLEAIIPSMVETRYYEVLPEYPAVRRDIALLVDKTAEFESVKNLFKAESTLLESVDLVEIYEGKGIENGKKSMTLGLKLRSADKTLASEEVDAEMKKFESVATEKLGAEVR